MKILWLEDEANTKKLMYKNRLANSHELRIAETVREVMDVLDVEFGWQVLLIDLWVAAGSEQYYRRYGQEDSLVGLHFLHAQKARLEAMGCCPMIFTSDRGTPPQDIARKLKLDDVPYISAYSIDDKPKLLVTRIEQEFKLWTARR